ncbi:MAG: Superoxide dismutase [Frankiales bacterium]|nr:Superoxide dismutase [Frankiales bacterium]
MSRTRTRTRTALLAPLALAGLLSAVVPAAPASAATSTTTYTLPSGVTYPEGVTAVGDVFYVTSTTDGTLLRGTAGSRAMTVFEKGGTDGRTTAIGLEVTRRGDRLVVAGGDTGQAFVYDTKDGRLVAKYTNGKTSGTFLNDVAIAPNGDAYVTDSQSPVLYRIPAAQIASGTGTTRPLQVFRDFTGTAFRYVEGFNANGIAVTQDGKSVLVVQSGTGALFRVVLASKKVTRVDLGGATVANGDGLERRGDVLYVTRNANAVISKVKLAADGSRGRLYGQVTNRTFRYPTTSVFAGGRLLVVNSQFDKRSAGAAPETPFTVTGITNP